MPTLKWIGKDKIINYHNEVPFCSLNEKKEYSVNGNETENLLIKGDNLEALKALLPFYYNRIKAIYIDPPYNTGNENWRYNDNVSSPEIRSWLGKVVGGEAEDLSRHDKWLCMMYPRLKLLWELLDEDGVIFASIDDNELYNLRTVMSAIFGESNFIALLPTVMNLKGNQDQFGFAGTHEYIVVFAKNRSCAKIKQFTLEEEEIEEWEVDEFGYFKKGANLKSTGVNAPREKRPNLYFPIYVSLNNEILLERRYDTDVEIYPITDGREMSWRWSKERIRNESHNLMVRGEGDSVVIYKKQRPAIGDLPSRKPKTLFYKPEYSSGNGTNQIRQIFGSKIFDNPKPLDLIKDIVYLATDENDIILDSFAGSGTTAHAVLDLNKEDGGNRKFILVEMENDIAEKVTAERLRRVIHGYSYKKSNGEEVKVEGLGGGLKFLELGAPLFDKHKQLIGQPSYEELAGYIYFTETRSVIDWGKANRDDWYVGESGGVHYFIIYGGKSELGEEFLEIARRYLGKKVAYADVVMIDDDELERFDIVFKQIPYEIKTF